MSAYLPRMKMKEPGGQRGRLRCRPVLMELENRQLLSLTALASFNGFLNGSAPKAGVIMDSSGNLYGTTTTGGTSNDGTVFELAKGSGTITTLASFNGTNGKDPIGRLIIDSSGNLYGTTYTGGAHGYGTVFELAKGSGTITTLASFNIGTLEYPEAGVIMDGSGNLYGTAGGGIFELAKGSGKLTTLASFSNGSSNPAYSGVIMDSSGNLYGTTSSGLVYTNGTVFELVKGSSTITTLASFNGTTNGGSPYAGVIIDSSGNLYGTTYDGGAHGYGTVFELAKGSGKITTLASFNPPTTGYSGDLNSAGVIMDSSGNLYSTTELGGASGYGTVFKLPKGSSKITTLASFNKTTNGAYPWAGGVIMDSSGNLYGTTYGGGTSGGGTVFEFTQSTPSDLAMTLAALSPDGQSVNASYTITGNDLASPGTIDFYWATGPSISDEISTTKTPVKVATKTAVGTYTASTTIASLGTQPANASYILAVADSPDADPVDYDAAASLQFNVDLAATDLSVASLPPKFTTPVDIHLDEFVATFTVRSPAPADQGAINSATGNASTNNGVPTPGRYLEITIPSVGSEVVAYATVQVTVTLFQEAPSSVALGSPPPPDSRLGTLLTGAHNVWLNQHNASDAVLEWYTPGFKTYLENPLGSPILVRDTGPLEDWVDIPNASSTSFTSIVQQAEQLIESTNSVIVFRREILPYLPLLMILDPGKTSLLVTDPKGNQTGVTAEGITTRNIPGSAYFQSIPLAVIAAPSPGMFQTKLTGLASGNYQFVTAMINDGQVSNQQSFTGDIAQGRSIAYFTTVSDSGNIVNTSPNPPINASASGLVYNRATQLFGGTITLTNTGPTALTGSLEVVLTGLPPGITLANASGYTADGNPYILVDLTNAPLAAGRSINFTVLFANPKKSLFQYGLTIFNA